MMNANSRKIILTLAMTVCAQTASAQFTKPPCQGDDSSQWSECVGKSSSIFSGDYTGEYKDGKYSGLGAWTLAKGEMYFGTFKNGVGEGFGIHHMPNGDIYVGGFTDDKYEGLGRYVTKSTGEVREGEWKDDKLIKSENLDKNAAYTKNKKQIERQFVEYKRSIVEASAASPNQSNASDAVWIVSNNSRQDVIGLYLTSSRESSWGNNKAPDNDRLKPGETYRVGLPNLSNGCQFDVRVKYANDKFEEKMNVDLCKPTPKLVFDGSTTSESNARAVADRPRGPLTADEKEAIERAKRREAARYNLNISSGIVCMGDQYNGAREIQYITGMYANNTDIRIITSYLQNSRSCMLKRGSYAARNFQELGGLGRYVMLRSKTELSNGQYMFTFVNGKDWYVSD